MKTLTAFMISIVMANVSLAQTSKRLQVADFKTSSDCKQCHQQIHDQWMTSTHSQAYRDPIYQAFLRRVDEQRQEPKPGEPPVYPSTRRWPAPN